MPYRVPGENADKIWLDEGEYHTFLRYLKEQSEASYLAFRLGGEASLRLNKQRKFCLSWRIEHPTPGVEIIFAEVLDRKYGGNKEIRKDGIIYIPQSLWKELEEYAERKNRGRDEPVIQRSGRQIRADCRRAGEKMAEDYDFQAYEEIRPHDSRRYFARTMHRVYGIDKQAVKYLGGWQTDSVFAEYAHLLTEQGIQNELARKGVLEIDLPAEPRETELNRLHQAVQDLTELVTADHKLERHGINYNEIAHLSEDDLLEFKQWLRHGDGQSARDRTLSDFLPPSNDDNESVKATAGPAAIGSIANWNVKRGLSHAVREIQAMKYDDNIVDPTTPTGIARIFLAVGALSLLVGGLLLIYPVWVVAGMLFVVWAVTVYRVDMEEPPHPRAAV